MWNKWFLRVSNQLTRFFVDATTIFIQKSSTETCYKENLSTEVFPWTFFHGRLWIGFFSDDTDFQRFLVVDKNFRGLPMGELGGFSFNKTSFLALHLYEIGSSGVPVSEMVLVLVSPLLKAVFMESIPVEQTSGTFIDKLNLIVLKSSKMVSMKFFESKQFPRNFSPWNWFPGEFSKQTCCMIFRSTYYVLKVLQKIKNSFFSMFQFFKRVFSEYLLLDMIFLTFPWKKSTSVVFLWMKFSLVDFSWMKNVFGIFNNETGCNGFPDNIFFHGVTMADNLFSWVPQICNWLQCFFSMNFLQGSSLIKSIHIVCFSIKMNLLCFLLNDCNFCTFLSLKEFALIFHEQNCFWRTS